MVMRQRIKKHPRRYPNWLKRNSPKWLCKERAGWKCELCGVAQRAILHNRDGDPYMCYLHAAHAHRLDPHQPEPIQGERLICLCPHCHGCYCGFSSYFSSFLDNFSLVEWWISGKMSKDSHKSSRCRACAFSCSNQAAPTAFFTHRRKFI